MARGAIFSDDGAYRYALWREWDTSRPPVLFVLLNPSTADALRDDRTVARCVTCARQWGYGSVCIGNLFGFRTPHREELRHIEDPVGPDNDRWLLELAHGAGIVVAGWGNQRRYDARIAVVRALLPPLHCLGLTAAGYPRHPLYARCGEALLPVPKRY